MGITGIRQGGSFASQPYKDSRDGHYCDQASMFWKRWEQRKPRYASRTLTSTRNLSGRKVRKRHFLRHLYIKCIILPRQARDKHREDSKKTVLLRFA
jgi:hypothetical protein